MLVGEQKESVLGLLRYIRPAVAAASVLVRGSFRWLGPLLFRSPFEFFYFRALFGKTLFDLTNDMLHLAPASVCLPSTRKGISQKPARPKSTDLANGES